MLVIGLTGNIGCGKSSFSQILVDKKIKVIDADIISRQIFENKDLLYKVFNSFGDEIRNIDNTLNRKILGNIVFKDDEKLKQLNNLTHPTIIRIIKEKIDEYKRLKEKIIILDAALLVEGGLLDIVNKVIVVSCDENIQLERIIRRDKCSEVEAKGRINAQMSQSEKIKYGDYIIDNSGTLIELKQKTEKFINYVKENWCD